MKQCQHGELWNVDDSTFCGCWGGRTVCQAAKRHRHLSNITPTPAIGVFGISVSPTLNEYQSGSSVNITCEYQGYPKPILVFTYNHKIIDDRPTQTIKGEYGSTVLVATLIINELTIRDTGSYSCLVMNKAGMAETVTKHIKVRPTQIGSAGNLSMSMTRINKLRKSPHVIRQNSSDACQLNQTCFVSRRPDTSLYPSQS